MIAEREGTPHRPLRTLDRAFVVIATLYLLGPALFARPRALGDSGEYLLGAESLFNHASADLRAEDARSLLAAGPERRIEGDLGSLYDAYRPDRDGRPYGIHFWAYSLSCLPAKLLLRWFGQNELKALQVTNACLFLLAVIRARRFAGTAWAPGFVLAGLLLLSPAAAFVLWPHPEAFCCALVILSLVFWREGRATAAVALTALASVQNAPLVLLAFFFWWEAARAARARSSARRAIVAPTLAFLPALWPFTFYLIHFGRLTPFVETGAVGLPNVSLGKALELFFDLNLGMLPYLPLALLGAMAAPLVQIASARRASPLVALWAVLLGMALICSSTGNWNHGTSGPSRYAIWMLPLVFVILASTLEAGATPERIRRAFGAWAVAALMVQAVIVVSRGGLAPRLDHLEHSYLAAFVLKHCPALYNPSHEIFVERTLGEEMRDGKISSASAVTYAPKDACRKALAQKRHWPDLLARCGSTTEKVPFAELAAANRRDLWVYVDYP